MDNWDEIRTAFHVAKAGTVSGAAEVLGVHHATVIRHIDALEGRMGVKLFQRHARGYTATEAGDDLLQVAQATEDQFTQLAGRIKGIGAGVTGDVIVTSLSFLSPFLAPVLQSFQDEHPDTRMRYLTDARLFRLEYGEAHVAVRAGPKPAQPDNVVQSFCKMPMHLVASKAYVQSQGMLKDIAAPEGHKFVGDDNPETPAPFSAWLRKNLPPDAVTYRTTSVSNMFDAIQAGAGIGFVTGHALSNADDLVQMMPTLDEWSVQLWLVTHVDLHRTSKVQACLSHLKRAISTISFCSIT